MPAVPAGATKFDRFLWQYPEHSTAPWWPRARTRGPALCLDVNMDKPEPEPLDPNDLICEDEKT